MRKNLIYGTKGQPRRFPLSQLLKVKTVGGQQIMVYVFEDLTNDMLQDQFRHYLEREDYDYLTELKAEADLRGIRLIKRKREVTND